jgi:multicomponent Na+:H+ antiporter subunit D
MNNILVIPILLPLLAAAATLALTKRPRIQAGIGIVTTAVSLVAAIMVLTETWNGAIIKLELSGWAAPYGVVLVADSFSAIMLTLNGVVGLAVAVFASGAIRNELGRDAQAPLALMLFAAVSGAFTTGDLFNLYVWFELLLLSSFVLLTLGGKQQQYEGAVKYVVLNLMSSTIFLAAAGLIYGALGTLNMAQLALRFESMEPSVAMAFATPLLVAFAIKAAVFPFFNWLPASYHTPPPAVSALFAGLLTKVGVYAMIRTGTLFFANEWSMLGTPLLILASLTMLSGVLGAVVQNDIRRILSFHIVSQIGYMIMGLGIALTLMGRAAEVRLTDPAAADALQAAAVLGLTGAIFYILHHIIAKTNLFLIAGAILRVRGTGDLPKLGGLQITHPHLAILFLISSMALAGIPILSGFWAKFVLIRAGIEGGFGITVTIALIVSLLTLFSMTKIWSNAFWKSVPSNVNATHAKPAGPGILIPVVSLAGLSIAIGIFAAPLYALSTRTAEQLLSRVEYINAVLPPEIIRQDAPGFPVLPRQTDDRRRVVDALGGGH